MPNPLNTDPFAILGLAEGADEKAVRARYLELIKKHPPDRDAERFREIHTAYEATKDPLAIARRILASLDADPPSWSEAIEPHKSKRPSISVDFLLSLGNR